MTLPFLFRQIHTDRIFGIWIKGGQPPYVQLIPQEPQGGGVAGGMSHDAAVTLRVHCWNDRGMMRFEAASAVDLKVAQEWEWRHKDTQPEAFKWLPRPL